MHIHHHHHHHHVPEGLGVFPVPWSSRWSWSLQKKCIYFSLNCIMYDKLLKPRQSFRITLYIQKSVQFLHDLCHAVRRPSSSYSRRSTVGPFTVTSTVTYILLARSRPTQGLPLTLSNKFLNKNFLYDDPVALYISVSQPLWDRGPVNSFLIRRWPGPKKFTRK